MKRATIMGFAYTADVKRLLVCVEVDVPTDMQVCYDVNSMPLHLHALFLREYLAVFRDKLAVAFDKIKNLQKLGFMKEFKDVVDEMLKEDRYQKVLDVLFVISYPDIVQALERDQQDSNKMFT
jgi:hypothetical protein